MLLYSATRISYKSTEILTFWPHFSQLLRLASSPVHICKKTGISKHSAKLLITREDSVIPISYKKYEIFFSLPLHQDARDPPHFYFWSTCTVIHYCMPVIQTTHKMHKIQLTTSRQLNSQFSVDNDTIRQLMCIGRAHNVTARTY